ncbi:response regulator [Flavobacterium sp. KS-LB2]|uniref:response regulator transcription factor n=1 Tax=Flavobacterium sp. KS-LB2 TaxID=3120525 RepID=UPI0030CD0A50
MSKILIIEDEEALRETVAELLLIAGYEIAVAKDGLDGLKKVQEEVPDLILCDVMMPKLDGYGFLEQHQLSIYSHIPVVLLTAKIELDDEILSLKLGAKGYVRKPFNFLELNRIIRCWLFSE